MMKPTMLGAPIQRQSGKYQRTGSGQGQCGLAGDCIKPTEQKRNIKMLLDLLATPFTLRAKKSAEDALFTGLFPIFLE
jgi:hypothetical protein